jgi:hypothetical protein
VAAARIEHDSLFGQFAAANPFRSQYQANDACHGKSHFPPLWLNDIHLVELGACPATIPRRMIELTVCGFLLSCKKEQKIGSRFAK